MGGPHQRPVGRYVTWQWDELEFARPCLALQRSDPVLASIHHVRVLVVSITRRATYSVLDRAYNAPTPYAGPTFTTIAPASYINSK